MKMFRIINDHTTVKLEEITIVENHRTFRITGTPSIAKDDNPMIEVEIQETIRRGNHDYFCVRPYWRRLRHNSKIYEKIRNIVKKGKKQ